MVQKHGLRGVEIYENDNEKHKDLWISLWCGLDISLW